MSFKIKTIVFDAYFEKEFEIYKKRLSKKKIEKLKERLIIFRNNPFDQRLKTHKLKGKLRNYWVFSISHSDRLMFRFLNKDEVFFINIGDHSIYK
jgi:addiction module RelE/StbE family toxin